MMKTIMRMARIVSIAVMFAVILSATTQSARPVYAGCGSGVTWSTSSEMDSRQTTSTQDWSSTSQQYSDDGQTFTGNQTFHQNGDGSSSSHEETNYTDQNGNGCNSDGEPWRGRHTEDEETDSQGNRKQHIEDIVEKNGKCEKWVRDREWDRTGKLIKDEKRGPLEIPCSKYTLEWSREGSVSAGGVTVQWGPDTAVILLGLKDGVYSGSQKGTFHATLSGGCSGSYNYPESVVVTAKEDEFEDLDFTVTVSIGMAGTITCPGGGGPMGNQPVTFTRTFTLPARDGESKVFSVPVGDGQIIDTFTLKERNP